MYRSNKILWGEGQFLRPQHFQLQDAYHEWRMAETAASLHPYAWGLRKLVVDADALTTGVLRIEQLQVILPDGELFNAPQDDPLPSPLSLQDVPAGAADITLYAVMAPVRSTGGNLGSAEAGGEGSVRYVQKNVPAADMFTQAAESETAVLQKVLHLQTEQEPRDHLVNLALCRIRRNATGGFELDQRFVAPGLTLESSPALRHMLRRLLDALQAKVNALYGFHREPSRHVIEFRSGDIASFWLLHTASSAFASLSHLHHHPGLHPERLFQQLLQLAGGLMTFSKAYALSDLPAYQHNQPGPAFARLETIIQELLETVISTRYFAIALREVKPSFHSGVLDSDKITPQTTLVLGVKAAMQPAELVEIVPIRFKTGAPDDVDKLVLSAMSGIRLTHLPQVPTAIPVRPGNYYFALDSRSPLYERMLKAQSISLYTPAGVPDLELELFALNN